MTCTKILFLGQSFIRSIEFFINPLTQNKLKNPSGPEGVSSISYSAGGKQYLQNKKNSTKGLGGSLDAVTLDKIYQK